MSFDPSHGNNPGKERVPLTFYEFDDFEAEAVAQAFELLIEDVKSQKLSVEDTDLSQESFDANSFEQILKQQEDEEREQKIEELRKKDTPRSRSIISLGEEIFSAFEKFIEDHPFDVQGYIRDRSSQIDSLRNDCVLEIESGNFMFELNKAAGIARLNGDYLLADKLEDISQKTFQ